MTNLFSFDPNVPAQKYLEDTKKRMEEGRIPSSSNIFELQTPNITLPQENITTTPILSDNIPLSTRERNLFNLDKSLNKLEQNNYIIQPNDSVENTISKINAVENSKEKEEIEETTEKELIKNNDWLDNAAIIYQYEEKKPWNSEFKNKEDLGKWFLSRHSRLGNRLTNAILTASEADEFPDYVKSAWLESLGQYDSADPTFRSVSRAIYYGLVDPINVPFLFTGTFAQATKTTAAMAARYSFKQALQKKARELGVKKLSKAQRKKLIKDTRRQQTYRSAELGAGFGGAFTGAYDAAHQNLMSEIDPEYKGYNYLQTLTQVLGGAAVGGVIGGAIPQAGYLLSDAFSAKQGKYARNKINDQVKDAVSQEKANEKLSPQAVFTEKDMNVLAAKQDEGPPSALRVLKKLEKRGELASSKIYKPGDKVIINDKGDTGTIVEYQPKNKQLGVDTNRYVINADKKVIKPTGETLTRQIISGKDNIDSYNTQKQKGLLYGAGRYNTKTKNIKEKKLAEDNFNNIEWSAWELPPNREFNTATKKAFAREEDIGNKDYNIVTSQNVLGTLNKTQAYTTIADMANSLADDGTLIISGGKQSVKKPEFSKEVDAADRSIARAIKDGKEYVVDYEEILKYNPKTKKKEGTGRFKEMLSEVVGVDDKFIFKNLKERFKDVRREIDNGQSVFIAKDKTKYIDPEPPPEIITKQRAGKGLIYRPEQVKFKNLAIFRPIETMVEPFATRVLGTNPRFFEKNFWKKFATSQGHLTDETYSLKIKKNQAQASVLQEGNKLTNELKKLVEKPKKGQEWVNSKGQLWKDWTKEEQEYGLAILNEILAGRRKFFTKAGDSRVNYMKERYRYLAPELLTYIKNNLNKDLVGDIPSDIIGNLAKWNRFKRTIQEEAEDTGLLEPGTRLHTQFIRSMGIDVKKTQDAGIPLTDKQKRIKIDAQKIKKPSEINLHLNTQYKAYSKDRDNWFNNIEELYPERVQNFKNLIRHQLAANDEEILKEQLSFGQKDLLKEYDAIKQALNARNPNTGELDTFGEILNKQIQTKYGVNLQQRRQQILTDEVDNIYQNYIDKFKKEDLAFIDESSELTQVNPFVSQDGLIAIRKTLEERGDLLDIYKSFMGQYTDPSMNFVNTIYKLRQNVENYRYEKAIAEAYKKGLFGDLTIQDKPYLDIRTKQWIQPSKTKTQDLVDLGEASSLPQVEGIRQPLRFFDRGQRVALPIEREIMESIKEGNLIGPMKSGPLMQSLVAAQGLSRAAVTYLTVGGYPRNYAGAGFKAGAAGNWSISALKEAHKFFKGLTGFSNRELDDALLKYTDLGITGTGTRAAELKAILSDVVGNPNLLVDVNALKASAEKRIKGKIPKDMNWFGMKAQDAYKFTSTIISRKNQQLLDWYQGMDDVWKIYSFLAERKRYEAILQEDPKILGFTNRLNNRGEKIPINPNDTKYTIRNADNKEIPITYLDDYAAMMVRKHMDNYGEVAQIFKLGRRLPTNDFLAFKVEQIRTIRNIVKTSMDDINEGNKLLKETNGERGSLRKAAGIKRLISFVGMISSGTAVAGASAAGIWYLLTPEKERNKGKYLEVAGEKVLNPYWSATGQGGLTEIGMADYSRGDSYIQLGPRRKDGSVLVMNYSRYNPVADYEGAVRESVKDLSNGQFTFLENIEKVGLGIGKKLYEMFGPTIVVQNIMNALNGVDEYGRPLSKDVDGYVAKVGSRLYEFFKSFIPGSIVQAGKLYDYYGQTGEGAEVALSPGGFQKNPNRELLNALGGAVELLQPKESFKFKIVPIINNIKQARQVYEEVFTGYKNPTEDEIVDAYTKALRIEKEMLNKLSNVIMAGYANGMSKADMYNSITSDKVFKSKYSGTIQNTVNLSPIYIPNINPITERIQDKLQDLELKSGRNRNAINFTPEVRQRLIDIQSEFSNTNFDFVNRLRKEED